MSIYAFCNSCKDKIYEYDQNGKLVNHTCPARYNPFDEDMVFDKDKNEMVKISKCTRHDKFMVLEKQKAESASAKKFGN